MTEPRTTGPAGDTNTPSLEGAENERSSAATKLTIGLAAVAVIVVVGLVLSIVMLFRGDDAEPLVSLDPTTAGDATAQVEDGLFEPDPVLDRVNRVIYVPIDPKGVILSDILAAANRSAEQAPSGVMLQRIHGNMDLPFSTSDGPTGFTDNGVATGFSRTAQGAALAAAHYGGFIASGADRLGMLMEAGLLSDPNGEAAKTDLGIPDSSPASALPMVKVLFHPDLTLVQFGRPVQKNDGSTVISYSKLPLVWRESTGWVLKIDPVGMSEGSEPVDAAGWGSWW